MAHRHPATLARIAAEGHLLANHSAEHVFMGSSYDADPDKLLNQLRDVDSQIEPLMKTGDKLFYRAPYGAWKSAHAEILNNRSQAAHEYIGPIYWDIGGDISMSRDGYVMSAADWDCWRPPALVSPDLRQRLFARNPPQGWRRGADALHSYS